METSFHYDLADKQLCFKLREKLTCKPDIELKGKAFFNTVSGGLQYRGSLKKFIQAGRLAAKEEGTTPLRIGAGVALLSRPATTASAASPLQPSPPLLTLSAKKKLALLDGPDTLLEGKAEVDLDLKGKPVSRRGSVRVSRKFMHLSKQQDVKVAVGLDADWPTTSKEPKLTPYVQLRENNWALHYQQRRWRVTYDL